MTMKANTISVLRGTFKVRDRETVRMAGIL
jgi:hypothetical protein